MDAVLKSSCVIALALLPGIAAGQEASKPPQPLQELFFTEVVYPQSRHEVQLTLGSFVDRAGVNRSTLTPFSIEFGLTDRLQVEAGWDGYSQFHTSPLAGLTTARWSLGAKYSLMNIAHSPLHAAVGMDVEFPRPTAYSEADGERNTEYEPFLALAADLGHGVTIFGSAGLSLEASQVRDLLHGPQAVEDNGTISGGALVKAERVTVAAEYTSRSDQAPWHLNGSPLLTPSLVVHPGREWELGVGVPIGIRHDARKPGIALHLIKEF